MIKNKKAESLIWIVIWVFILSFVIIAIWNLIWSSKDSIDKFDTKMTIDLLWNNASQVVNNLDLSSLYDWDVFYIYKDKTNKKFKIYIWEHNRQYKYINKLWEKIDDPSNYPCKVFERTFYAKKININWEQKTAVKILVKRLK